MLKTIFQGFTGRFNDGINLASCRGDVDPKSRLEFHDQGHAAIKKAREPCTGLDVTFFGYLYGEGFHVRHHQNARHALQAISWHQDYHYCIICGWEALGIIWNVQRAKEAAD